VAACGSAVIIGQEAGKVEDTVKELAKDGTAYGITADLADREQVQRVCQQLAEEHDLLPHPDRGSVHGPGRPQRVHR
jgi:NAD(P)-dependent dehydrogenase (short-subunit alcohol dehydrogenase family)